MSKNVALTPEESQGMSWGWTYRRYLHGHPFSVLQGVPS